MDLWCFHVTLMLICLGSSYQQGLFISFGLFTLKIEPCVYLWFAEICMCCIANLALHGWLLVSQFIQYRSVLAMLGQHYLGEGVSFSPPIKHSYRTSYRCPPWFVDIFGTVKLSVITFLQAPGYYSYMVEFFAIQFM